MLRTTLWILLLSVSLQGAPKPKAQTNRSAPAAYANEVVGKLQKTWDDSTTYQAAFRQIIFAKRIGTRDEMEGSIVVWKPNRLRWESKTEPFLQILNGNTLTTVRDNPRRKVTEVEIFNQAGQAVDSKILKFLSGKGSFQSLYRFQLVSETADIATVKFLPKGDDPETLVAEIDKKSYLLRSLTTENQDNRVRLEFRDIQSNIKVKPGLFEYKPKPQDVVRRQ